MIRTLIFDADGPLYQRGATVTQSKIDLLRQFGYQGDHGAFEGAYDKEKFRAYDRSESEAVMFSKIMAQLGVSMDEVQAKAFTSQFNEIQGASSQPQTRLAHLSYFMMMVIKYAS